MIDYQKAYKDWLLGRRIIRELSIVYNVSYTKITKEFDKFDVVEGIQEDALQDGVRSINLMVDATFFGREYGFLVFHDTNKVIYLKEIRTESVKHFRDGIRAIKLAGYTINSLTVDGRRGYINNARKILGNIPIQMCLFHQKAVVRRYITDRPRNQCGMDLKEVMYLLCKPEYQQEYIDKFYLLKDKYRGFLHERNEFGQYKHLALRSAFKSIDSNMLYLFTYTDFKKLNIPPTINHLEGLFGHLKERLKIHRGLTKNRKKRAIKFLLKNLGKN